jgi:hypothetical protein
MDRLGGKRWKEVEDYEGKAFIGSWGNHRGEVGQLQLTWLNEGESRNLGGKALSGYEFFLSRESMFVSLATCDLGASPPLDPTR